MTLADEFFTTLQTNREIQWLITRFITKLTFAYLDEIPWSPWNMVALSHFPTKYVLGENFVISQHFNIQIKAKL